MSDDRIRILHVINSFEFGGAEAMLCNLLLRTDRARFEPHVATLIDDMTVAGPLRDAGIPIATMGMRPGRPDPRGVLRLAGHMRRVRPAVVQTWMDHSNLIGGLAARLGWRAPVVWGVHHSDHVPGLTKRSTLLIVSACARLSRRLAARVVCCSRHARTLYERRGFDADRMLVIPNGFDTAAFRPDPAAGAELRRELGLTPGTPVIGLAARYDPMKDHETFLRAAAALVHTHPRVRFLLCGAKVDTFNDVLAGEIARLGLTGSVHLLGPRRDMPRVYAAMDVATSSSLSEAFPLAVGEAMACGVPCAVTDVGDSGLIVGRTGPVVPPRDPGALAAAWAELLNLAGDARRQLGDAARQRIVEEFALDGVVRRYHDLYEQLACRHAGAAPRSAARDAPVPSPLPVS